MSSERVLVTGGCGFIGSNLVHALVAKGYVVEVIDDLSNGHMEFLLDGPEQLDVRMIPINMLRAYEEQKTPCRADSRHRCTANCSCNS